MKPLVPILAALMILVGGEVQAADLTLKNHGREISINGALVAGDYGRFKDLVTETWSKGYRFYGRVEIISMGGNVVEAVQIGRLIRRLWLATIIPSDTPKYGDSTKCREFPNRAAKIQSNCYCGNSCFLVFVAGVNRWGDLVAIHRPDLPPERASEVGLEEVFGRYRGLKALLHKYFDEMGVSATYYDRMMSVSSSDVTFLNRKEVDKNFFGYVPEIDELFRARCGVLTSAENRWISDNWGRMQRRLLSPSDDALFTQLLREREKEIKCQAELLREQREKSYREWVKEGRP